MIMVIPAQPGGTAICKDKTLAPSLLMHNDCAACSGAAPQFAKRMMFPKECAITQQGCDRPDSPGDASQGGTADATTDGSCPCCPVSSTSPDTSSSISE